MTTSHDDALAAAEIAAAAGAVLLELRAGAGPADALKAARDTASQQCIAAALAARFPTDAVLSEATADESDRLANRRVWIVDVLDGTREFSEPPRDVWAVHVALVEDGDLVAGAVALPATGVTRSCRWGRRAPRRWPVVRAPPTCTRTGWST